MEITHEMTNYIKFALTTSVIYFKMSELMSVATKNNIAGRLPENSRNSFVDLWSKKNKKKTDQKIVFSLRLRC